MTDQRNTPATPWAWIPTLYFAQGLPYVVVMTLSVILYKNMGVNNTDIALYTSWLYLPWVIKPLWSPLIELLGTKRVWIVALQFAVGTALACVALTIPGPGYFRMTLAVFWLMAFASASHDIAADGFYMLALPQHSQAAFVGVRSTFYRLANIGGQGGLVYLAGELQERTGSMQTAWSMVFGVLTALFVAMAVYNWLVLPRPPTDMRGAGHARNSDSSRGRGARRRAGSAPIRRAPRRRGSGRLPRPRPRPAGTRRRSAGSGSDGCSTSACSRTRAPRAAPRRRRPWHRRTR